MDLGYERVLLTIGHILELVEDRGNITNSK